MAVVFLIRMEMHLIPLFRIILFGILNSLLPSIIMTLKFKYILLIENSFIMKQSLISSKMQILIILVKMFRMIFIFT